jgi:hypothetical protein
MVFRRSRVTYPLFYPKRSGKKESGSRASIVRVFGLVYNPRFSLFSRKKAVGSKESGSRARASVVRVFGLFITPGSPFFPAKRGGGKQRVWI